MSYILDALRRAESERERGHVPNLHSPSAPVTVAEDGPAARSAPWPWIVAGALALLLVGGAVWLWPSSREPIALPPAPVAAAPRPPAQIQPPATVPLGPAMTRVESPQAAPAPVAPPPVAARPAVPPFVPVVVPVPATPPARDAAAAERLPTASELPEALRRELPTLTIGGAMYSDMPANRMLIINGQVLHEGDKVAPALVLEQIGLKGAVLTFKGQRYSISF